MRFRYLGNSGLKISEITYGNWLTHGSQVENEVAAQCVQAALDAGISTFDTADVYANTAAEAVLGEALKGDGEWYGKLMADHTALDWRDSIRASFGSGSGSETKVLVVASSRSGCFPAEGPMKVVEFVNGVPGPGQKGTWKMS